MISPRDFEYLTEELTKCGSRLSESTLKRIWGYNRDISDTYKPYSYTLVSLVNFLGYNDIEDFMANYDKDEIQSGAYLGETVTSEQIMTGSVVEISWAPNRVCTLLCIEKGVFKVVHSEHGRLYPGDVVRFLSLTQNAPLYFNEVQRLGSPDKFVYTAGQRTGIHYHIRGIVNTNDESLIS
ncbi:MAG: hypothetical protein K2M56_00665 [Muribaculaceae bacterium]|nr:hypothetical protein [Muribaculaceae bacterium]